MKHYNEFEKTFIGISDIASLILVGCNDDGVKTELLSFNQDGRYQAYIIDENTTVGEHYKKVTTFNHWLKIYDDTGLTFYEWAKEINLYRAGEMGCIIQLIK
jgi:hypothetical protein